MLKRIEILIINFNTSKYLINCINSIKITHSNCNYKFIIVDNQSFITEIEKIKNAFPELDIQMLPENYGFAKANNAGAKNANSEYLCFLNPDTLLTEDFISPLVYFIENNDSIGICAPMLVYEDRSYQSSTGFKMGVWFDFMEAFYLIGIIRKCDKSKYDKLKNTSLPVQVGWVSGACMIVKRSVFEKVGRFSEDYFLNYEDIDLCRKVEEAGYKNYYFPDYKCIHLDHKSFDSNYELLVYSRYESRLIYAKLHYNLFQRVTARMIHISGLIIRIIAVNLYYSGIEKKSRQKGYFKSLKLYLGLQT